jgi:hypothetical protein
LCVKVTMLLNLCCDCLMMRSWRLFCRVLDELIHHHLVVAL